MIHGIRNQPKITVLLAARKNSKYLAKFLFGLYERTGDLENIEVICMANGNDTWNEELFYYYGSTITGSGIRPVRFMFEDMGLGRAGLAVYFNLLVKHAKGDWIIYFCEDHFINSRDWDLKVLAKIRDLALDPAKVYCLIPKFDNAGAMNQILSRGYIKAMGGYMAQHGNLDSYINDVNHLAFGMAADRENNKLGDRVIKFDEDMFHDFTHDHPSPMDDAHLQSVISDRGLEMPKYDDPMVAEWIAHDAQKIKMAMEAENE